MKDKIFFVNSGFMVVADLCDIFYNDRSLYFAVADGLYCADFAYNDKSEIFFLRMIHTDYVFSEDLSLTYFDTIFCTSSTFCIFDGNFYSENIVAFESQNKLYDLCCEISICDCGYGVIDNACFICNCSIGKYDVQLITDGLIVIGIQMILNENVKQNIIE